MIQTGAKKQVIVRTHLKIKKIVDGDGLIVTNLFNQKDEEIRLLGIDAPELKRCRKLIQDERGTHLAAHFLMKLARQPFAYLSSIAPAGTSVTLVIEANNTTDVYGRTLAYVYMSGERCLNEMMIAGGYAKPFAKYYCQEQSSYAVKNAEAKLNKRGLYSLVNHF